ncbi:uncharacterized protein EMH_0045010 [Eimeria mitis]|uniref:Uncharacterized protein n=1 Tax=Eimeria mitis TaxID=44415 RepID=U6K465_9EIME|nr:uncharacterized protein EMH_0045010 [Eimeria mitis]CDJ32515.1 hypothetical protein EMH_0045010 [Eimeria mitis]
MAISERCVTEHQGVADRNVLAVSCTTTLVFHIAISFADPLLAAHALDPEAWLEGIPYASGETGEEEKAQSASPEVVKPDDKQESALEMLLLRDVHGAQDPSSPFSRHPYVRLPQMGKDLFIRPINMNNVFVAYHKKAHPYIFLQKLRKWFARPVLGQDDVNNLLRDLEGLIGAAWRDAEKRPRRLRPVYAAETLGKHLLEFDAIVCGIELLGGSMRLPLWWNRFVAAFDHRPSALLPQKTPRLGGFYRRLTRRLLDALEIYKRGKRPPLCEIIDLKTIIFSEGDAPARFRDPKWDPWREDAKGP